MNVIKTPCWSHSVCFWNKYYALTLVYYSFRSVVVITFASHAKGPRFETGRKHTLAFCTSDPIHHRPNRTVHDIRIRNPLMSQQRQNITRTGTYYKNRNDSKISNIIKKGRNRHIYIFTWCNAKLTAVFFVFIYIDRSEIWASVLFILLQFKVQQTYPTCYPLNSYVFVVLPLKQRH